MSFPDVCSSGIHGAWFLGMTGTLVPGGEQYITAMYTTPGIGYPLGYEPGWTRRTMAAADGGGSVLFVYEGISNNPGARQHIYARVFWPVAVWLPMIFR